MFFGQTHELWEAITITQQINKLVQTNSVDVVLNNHQNRYTVASLFQIVKQNKGGFYCGNTWWLKMDIMHNVHHLFSPLFPLSCVFSSSPVFVFFFLQVFIELENKWKWWTDWTLKTQLFDLKNVLTVPRIFEQLFYWIKIISNDIFLLALFPVCFNTVVLFFFFLFLLLLHLVYFICFSRRFKVLGAVIRTYRAQHDMVLWELKIDTKSHVYQTLWKNLFFPFRYIQWMSSMHSKF